jgi:glycosyltransferase involved in cell wall biosynthesis
MKKILLISNKVFHYRLKVYNHFYQKFKESDFELILLANEIQEKTGIVTEFDIHIESFNLIKYLRIIKSLKPDYVIIFLHLKNLIMIPIITYLRMRKIPVVYWNHGVNQLDPNNLFKNSIYYLIHSLADRILLYSPNEKKYIRPKNQNKIYIANNTIVFDENLYPVNANKIDLKKKLDVESNFNILFVGRDRIYKKLEIIIDLVKSIDNRDIGLLIVGPLSDKQKTFRKIGNCDNIKYLGEIYDKNKLSEIYSVSDIFCIPGTNGLGLNEAMFWGLPCLTLNVRHSPEIWYLKNGENGYILNTISELRKTIIKLYDDEALLRKLSSRSREIILSQGHINNMYRGFKEVIESFDS